MARYTKHNIEDWDFRDCPLDNPSADVEAEDFLSENYATVVATDAARLILMKRLVEHGIVELDDDKRHARWAGRGISSALIEFALEQVRESGVAIVLETGTPRNVPLYERLGFKVVEEADSPEGGPHVWFMRRNPSLARTSDPFSRPTPSTSARSD